MQQPDKAVTKPLPALDYFPFRNAALYRDNSHVATPATWAGRANSYFPQNSGECVCFLPSSETGLRCIISKSIGSTHPKLSEKFYELDVEFLHNIHKLYRSLKTIGDDFP